MGILSHLLLIIYFLKGISTLYSRVCTNFQQSPIGFSVDHTDHIMILVNVWFPTGKCRNVDAPFWIDSTY